MNNQKLYYIGKEDAYLIATLRNAHVHQAKQIKKAETKEYAYAYAQVKKLADSGMKASDLWLERYKMMERFYTLHHHRKFQLRDTVRAETLAVAFLKGKPYRSVERKRKDTNEQHFQKIVKPLIVRTILTNARGLQWKMHDPKYVFPEAMIQQIKDLVENWLSM